MENTGTGPTQPRVSRRTLLRLSAAAAAAPAVAGLVSGPLSKTVAAAEVKIVEATIADLQAAMEARQLTARALVDFYLERIEALDQRGPTLRSFITVNPAARDTARDLDRERRDGQVRGPLHGIPILLKDNIDTHDMETTAGSLALKGDPPPHDATVAARLRRAGAIILGKANMSEWANFRSTRSSSGWSGVGRQGVNPYVLDRSPCGSSSGSAQATSANLVAASLGTETNGSIVCPSSVNGLVGLKPTVGLTSRAGVVPIAHTQDTVGPMTRTVADAAAVLGALVGVDPRDPATAASAGKFHRDYTRFLDRNALRGARIGIARDFFGVHELIDAVAEPAIQVLRDLGAVVIENVRIPTIGPLRTSPTINDVLLFEFKADLNAYLSTRTGLPVRTLADLIAFNDSHAAAEMPYFRQELFLQAQAKGPLTDPAYLSALATNNRISKTEGLDKVFRDNRLDALFAPTRNPAWRFDQINGDRSMGGSSTAAALAGYPLITLTAGMSFGQLPVGVTFMGLAFSEPQLLGFAFAFEQATQARKAPQLLKTLELP